MLSIYKNHIKICKSDLVVEERGKRLWVERYIWFEMLGIIGSVILNGIFVKWYVESVAEIGRVNGLHVADTRFPLKILRYYKVM